MVEDSDGIRSSAKTEQLDIVEKRNVKIEEVLLSADKVKVNRTVGIDVTVENDGWVEENFTLATYYNSSATDWIKINDTDVTLTASNVKLMHFVWNTTGVPQVEAYYQVLANATLVPYEENTEDNNMTSDPIFVVSPEVHDVAVIDVSPSQTIVIVGDSVSIYVTVENQGTEAETFDVAVYCDGIVIDGVTGVYLEAGETDVLSFTWDTTGVDLGIYVVSAEASIVEGEENIEDNVYVDGEVEVIEGATNCFEAGTWNDITYYVNITSNSTVNDFYFNPDIGPFIRFTVTGSSGTKGVCQVAIPKPLLWVEDRWQVYIDEQPLTNYTIIQDENSTYLYFTYTHSTKTVLIQGNHVIPEFPLTTIIALCMVISLITLILAKRKHSRHQKP